MATPNPLPSTRHLLTSLISTIASSTQQQNQGEETSNPLSNTAATSQNTKSAFLTLHSLFPHDFLPALDLLDRGLVTRFILTGDSEASEQLGPDRSGGGSDDHGDKNDNNEARTEEILQDENQAEQRPHTQQTMQKASESADRQWSTKSAARSAQNPLLPAPNTQHLRQRRQEQVTKCA
jgi:TATA-binding protein-associated factor Taf7